MKIPLAEHFHSLQGEGEWVGTPMHFLRLAGCSVGKKRADYPVEKVPRFPNQTTAWECQTWDGRRFWCDTNFKKKEEIELFSLLKETWEDHICLTGGEPLDHPQVVSQLIENTQKMIHIETSGTKCVDFQGGSDIWITVAPKKGVKEEMLRRANEIKLLVDEQFDPLHLPLLPEGTPVFLSPVNGLERVNPLNLDKCLRLLERYPHWRLSVQLHKYLGVR